MKKVISSHFLNTQSECANRVLDFAFLCQCQFRPFKRFACSEDGRIFFLALNNCIHIITKGIELNHRRLIYVTSDLVLSTCGGIGNLLGAAALIESDYEQRIFCTVFVYIYFNR